MTVLASLPLLDVLVGQQAGFRPGSRLTFFASPKKVSKERRAGCVAPALKRRVRCVARLGRGARKLAALKHARPLIRPNLRYSPPHNGGGNPTTEYQQPPASPRYARTAASCAERSNGTYSPTPFCMRRGAELGADQGWRCLSEASLARPRPKRAPQVARSVAEGRIQQGRLSFGDFSLAKQRKVTALSGAHPDMHPYKPSQQKENSPC